MTEKGKYFAAKKNRNDNSFEHLENKRFKI